MKSLNYSIKKRLLLWISVPILTASLLIILLAFLFSRHEIEEVYDSQLVHTAKTLLQLTKHEIGHDHSRNISLGTAKGDIKHKYENKTAFRIWHNDSLAIESAKAKDFAGLEAPPGFSKQIIDGKSWRFFVYLDPSRNLRVETSERYSIRYELIMQLMISLALPMSILIPSLLAIVLVGIQKSLKPLIDLSAAVDTRDTDDLTAIDGSLVPLEATPLVQALNRLFRRISDSFRREREFTDHAAHELRTPLAAMKTQTQVLMKKAASIPEYREGLENLNATINRSTHLLEQLLSLARLQNENIPISDVNLSDCVHDIIAEIGNRISEKSQSLEVTVPDHVHVKGHGDSLYILIRNLIDNAIKYTPSGGKIGIDLTADGKLTITDTGPGIADKDKETVFRRFVRVDKSGQTGSGLGLSIAQHVASGHNADLGLKDNKPHGLVVELDFRP